MSLTPGTRLGPYAIVSAIGAGGMGTVYRATDTSLGRQVAIKVLPDAFAQDAERLARFEREAKTLAALNHPHIAAIYGFERSSGTQALVMELVEGEDLSERIARGALPVDEALPIATQIADALEAAHEQGIVHRDLKPANIKVRADGTVKVLDFGLAKAMESSPGLSPGASNSPTITSPALVTGAGIILGTAAYMAPEQARGKIVDKRADIWAFGAVLFEMLAGQRAFDGEDIADLLGAVTRLEPRWELVPSSVPPRVRQVLRACLQKNVKARLAHIQDVRLALEGAFETAAPQTTPLDAATPRSVVARALPWAVAGVFGVVMIAGLVISAPWRSAPVPTPRTLLASIGVDALLSSTAYGASAVLSPDGTTLAFVAQQAGPARLFIRKLDQLEAAPLAGTEGAQSPFFSPDGQWLAFFAGGTLKKVSVTGGAAVTLCDARGGQGGTWADDDTILFARPQGALMRVSAAGGTPAAFGALSTGATTQRWPQALPGGEAVLYSEHSVQDEWDAANLVVAPLSGGAPTVVVRGGYYGRYVPSGHLIYLQQGVLFAVRFDRDRLETVGQAEQALGAVAASGSGGAQLAVSSEGTLVYVPGTAPTTGRAIDWLTRDGKTAVLRATKADWANPRFSPDGQKLAVEINDRKNREIWVYEWARDTLTQLTFDPGQDKNPVWTPDGRRLVFASDRAVAGTFNLYWLNADGTGEVTRLTDSPENQQPMSWHPSGRFLVFTAGRGATGDDLLILPMEGDATRGWTPGTPTVFLGTPAAENQPMFSPDGRWMAYSSNETGGGSVFVRPFPGPGGKWRISSERGVYARWSATTPELLFRFPEQSGQIMATSYTVVGEAFRAGTPQPWSPTISEGWSAANVAYDLHPDGTRVATAVAPYVSAVQGKVVFVFNFGDYLRTIAPGSK